MTSLHAQSWMACPTSHWEVGLNSNHTEGIDFFAFVHTLNTDSFLLPWERKIKVTSSFLLNFLLLYWLVAIGIDPFLYIFYIYIYYIFFCIDMFFLQLPPLFSVPYQIAWGPAAQRRQWSKPLFGERETKISPRRAHSWLHLIPTHHAVQGKDGGINTFDTINALKEASCC